MTQVHNISEIMRRTGLSRESLCRLRQASVIEQVGSSPLGRPLFPSCTYGRIERAEQLRELGMSLDQVSQTLSLDPDAARQVLAERAGAAQQASNG